MQDDNGWYWKNNSGVFGSRCSSEHQSHSWETESASWTHWPPAWPASENHYCALPTQSGQQTGGTKEDNMKWCLLFYFFSKCVDVWLCWWVHLGLVPLLRFLHVLQGDGLILSPDVLQSTSEVWSGSTVHLHLKLLRLDSHLDILDFLEAITYGQAVKNNF